jgi:hypothetical protein
MSSAMVLYYTFFVLDFIRRLLKIFQQVLKITFRRMDLPWSSGKKGDTCPV